MAKNRVSFSGKPYTEHPSLPLLISEDGDIMYNGSKKTVSHTGGYAQISFKVNGKWTHLYVHRLVAETYLPNPDNKPTVDHINRVRDDNRVCNLRWATYTEQRANRPKRGEAKYTQYYAPASRVKEHQQRYWAKNKERLLEYYRERYQTNKEYYKEYYQKNKERIQIRRKAHYQKNKERIQEYDRERRRKKKELTRNPSPDC